MTNIPVIKFGTFSKGIHGSIAINFSESGGPYCHDGCDFKKNGDCYAIQSERFRKTARTANQNRRENLNLWLDFITSKAAKSVYDFAPWIRISSHGALPPAEALSETQWDAMRKFGDLLRSQAHKVHLPIEEPNKALLYRELFGIDPRLSLQRRTDPAFVRSTVDTCQMPVLVSADAKTKRGKACANRVLARSLQKQYINAGLTTKVCPAIIGDAKCGRCTLCTENGPDVIIYPKHR